MDAKKDAGTVYVKIESNLDEVEAQLKRIEDRVDRIVQKAESIPGIVEDLEKNCGQIDVLVR